jgi:hypothetical protein
MVLLCWTTSGSTETLLAQLQIYEATWMFEARHLTTLCCYAEPFFGPMIALIAPLQLHEAARMPCAQHWTTYCCAEQHHSPVEAHFMLIASAQCPCRRRPSVFTSREASTPGAHNQDAVHQWTSTEKLLQEPLNKMSNLLYTPPPPCHVLALQATLKGI